MNQNAGAHRVLYDTLWCLVIHLICSVALLPKLNNCTGVLPSPQIFGYHNWGEKQQSDCSCHYSFCFQQRAANPVWHSWVKWAGLCCGGWLGGRELSFLGGCSLGGSETAGWSCAKLSGALARRVTKPYPTAPSCAGCHRLCSGGGGVGLYLVLDVWMVDSHDIYG